MQLNNEEIGFITRWAKIKERGRWHYIVWRGMLWGMLVSGLSHLFTVWTQLKAWDALTFLDSYASSDFFVRFFIFSAVGCGLHAYHWNFKTKRYNQLKSQERRSQVDPIATKQ